MNDAEVLAKTAGTWEWIAKNWLPTLYMLAVAAFGGFVNFRQRMIRRHVRIWNITELLMEMLISSFAGFVTYFICRGLGVNDYLIVAAVAISGHMGPRAIFIYEAKAKKFIEDK